jgi:hypothetical protein
VCTQGKSQVATAAREAHLARLRVEVAEQQRMRDQLRQQVAGDSAARQDPQCVCPWE